MGLLFLLPAIASGLSFEPAKSDTIIIDGKLVVVNRIVQYENDDVQEEPTFDRSTDYRFSWGINVLPNLSYGIVQGTGELESLTSFTGTNWSGEPGFDGSVNSKIYKDSDTFYSLGLGFSLLKFQNEFFSESSLHDSLWKFESFETGTIDQITIYHFDIGPETDTIHIELHDSDLAITALRVPMSVGWFLPDGKKSNSWVVETGLVHHFVVSKTGGPVVLLNQNAERAFYLAENIGIRKYGLSVFAAAGRKWRLDGVGRRDKVSASVKGFLEAPILGVTDKSSDVSLKYFKFGVQLSLNIFLADKG